MKSALTPAVFEYLLQHKNIQQGFICIKDCKVGVGVQLLKFCSAHKDEGNPQIDFFFHLLWSRETVCVPRTHFDEYAD